MSWRAWFGPGACVLAGMVAWVLMEGRAPADPAATAGAPEAAREPAPAPPRGDRAADEAPAPAASRTPEPGGARAGGGDGGEPAGGARAQLTGAARALSFRDDVCPCTTRACWLSASKAYRTTALMTGTRTEEEWAIVDAASRETTACIQRIDADAAAVAATP